MLKGKHETDATSVCCDETICASEVEKTAFQGQMWPEWITLNDFDEGSFINPNSLKDIERSNKFLFVQNQLNDGTIELKDIFDEKSQNDLEFKNDDEDIIQVFWFEEEGRHKNEACIQEPMVLRKKSNSKFTLSVASAATGSIPEEDSSGEEDLSDGESLLGANRFLEVKDSIEVMATSSKSLRSFNKYIDWEEQGHEQVSNVWYPDDAVSDVTFGRNESHSKELREGIKNIVTDYMIERCFESSTSRDKSKRVSFFETEKMNEAASLFKRNDETDENESASGASKSSSFTQFPRRSKKCRDKRVSFHNLPDFSNASLWKENDNRSLNVGKSSSFKMKANKRVSFRNHPIEEMTRPIRDSHVTECSSSGKNLYAQDEKISCDKTRPAFSSYKSQDTINNILGRSFPVTPIATSELNRSTDKTYQIATLSIGERESSLTQKLSKDTAISEIINHETSNPRTKTMFNNSSRTSIQNIRLFEDKNSSKLPGNGFENQSVAARGINDSAEKLITSDASLFGGEAITDDISIDSNSEIELSPIQEIAIEKLDRKMDFDESQHLDSSNALLNVKQPCISSTDLIEYSHGKSSNTNIQHAFSGVELSNTEAAPMNPLPNSELASSNSNCARINHRFDELDSEIEAKFNCPQSDSESIEVKTLHSDDSTKLLLVPHNLSNVTEINSIHNQEELSDCGSSFNDIYLDNHKQDIKIDTEKYLGNEKCVDVNESASKKCEKVINNLEESNTDSLYSDRVENESNFINKETDYMMFQVIDTNANSPASEAIRVRNLSSTTGMEMWNESNSEKCQIFEVDSDTEKSDVNLGVLVEDIISELPIVVGCSDSGVSIVEKSTSLLSDYVDGESDECIEGDTLQIAELVERSDDSKEYDSEGRTFLKNIGYSYGHIREDFRNHVRIPSHKNILVKHGISEGTSVGLAMDISESHGDRDGNLSVLEVSDNSGERSLITATFVKTPKEAVTKIVEEVKSAGGLNVNCIDHYRENERSSLSLITDDSKEVISSSGNPRKRSFDEESLSSGDVEAGSGQCNSVHDSLLSSDVNERNLKLDDSLSTSDSLIESEEVINIAKECDDRLYSDPQSDASIIYINDSISEASDENVLELRKGQNHGKILDKRYRIKQYTKNPHERDIKQYDSDNETSFNTNEDSQLDSNDDVLLKLKSKELDKNLNPGNNLKITNSSTLNNDSLNTVGSENFINMEMKKDEINNTYKKKQYGSERIINTKEFRRVAINESVVIQDDVTGALTERETIKDDAKVAEVPDSDQYSETVISIHNRISDSSLDCRPRNGDDNESLLSTDANLTVGKIRCSASDDYSMKSSDNASRATAHASSSEITVKYNLDGDSVERFSSCEGSIKNGPENMCESTEEILVRNSRTSSEEEYESADSDEHEVG